ncbi:hypothetical protein AS156_28560 [Bradyrhizobium macuxiense]|uniref:Uncharacterized protein n=1 Tax=Bradyrhizobium macuxiense TaxID=1755647 RepID=A0A109K4H0_9BRAD|nr:hypothetical protein [Bradyrhizobium macuxiense]KWV60535.1 hypothetical protein AS156_28560 [Bradyrhizobium macuxiense]
MLDSQQCFKAARPILMQLLDGNKDWSNGNLSNLCREAMAAAFDFNQRGAPALPHEYEWQVFEQLLAIAKAAEAR